MGNKFTKQESSPKEDKDRPTMKEQKQDKDQKKSTFQKLLARFQIRSKKSESPTQKLQNGDTKTLPPPPKPPLRNASERIHSKHCESNESLKQSQWTDIPLQVPDSSFNQIQEKENKIVPKPPPRKHKIKLNQSQESPDIIEKAIMSFDQNLNVTLDNRLPVEEALIVPQKVVEHVCDGTHHHVRNVINGKVVDQIIPLKDKENKQNKSAAKHASTLSLPSYVDLKKKEEKRAPSPTKTSKKKSSASSLPTDKKGKPAHTTAEKIESYMMRCKSFGSIIPQSKNDKLKVSDKNSDRESIDSWSGLEDWDLGIIEHDVSSGVSQVPTKSKIKKARNESEKNIKQTDRNLLKQREDLIYSMKPVTKEFDEVLTSMNQSLNKKQQSPQNTPPLPLTPESREQITPQKQSYPFHSSLPKNVFENDAFFAAELILNERKSHRDDMRKITENKLAPLAAFDSDKESEKDSIVDVISIDEVDDKISRSKTEQQKPPVRPLSYDSKFTDKSAPKLIPRRKSSSGHSKLLKYIKDDRKNTDKQLEMEIVKEHKVITHEIIEKTESMEKIEEPEIVPMIKNVDGLWNSLTTENEINNTSLLDQESTISDLVETSSDDTRSTAKSTIEISHK